MNKLVDIVNEFVHKMATEGEEVVSISLPRHSYTRLSHEIIGDYSIQGSDFLQKPSIDKTMFFDYRSSISRIRVYNADFKEINDKN